MHPKGTFLLLFQLTFAVTAFPQLLTQKKDYNHADSLRGGIGPERIWWDALHYDLHVAFATTDQTLSGYNTIQYKVLKASQRMQIDLMEPLGIDSIVQDKQKVSYKREGNVYHVTLSTPQTENSVRSITVYYHGKPQVAARPPWDGGVVWASDEKGRPWISVACQGLGSSVWYPCKDHQYDEPDSAAMWITAPAGQVAVANGRLRDKTTHGNATTWHWAVSSPINDYNLIPYVGTYVSFNEVYKGEGGNLDLSWWVLDYNLDKARKHLEPSVRHMLAALEYWFGPYPFYADGYKIVDAPHLGMEHQSAIAYGNKYLNGYLGRDLSGTGWGQKWDFIVVHESAHEWFGNNITTKDLADMWVHESFANYSETLFIEKEYGKSAGSDYIIGTRKGIRNDTPIIGIYNVNEEGSGDMYPKGGNLLHTIRQVINDDDKFRQILRGLNRDFYHQTVTTGQIESYISDKAGLDLSKIFDQYLRTVQIPAFNWSTTANPGFLTYLWTTCIPGFNMPVKVMVDGKEVWLKPSEQMQKIKISGGQAPEKIVDRNFYVLEQKF